MSSERGVVVVEAEARFRAVYGTHEPDVLAYFLRRLDREDSVEATADVFLVVWRRIEEAPGDDEVRPWLFGVARNVLRNRERSKRRRYRLLARVASIRDEGDPPPDAVVVRRAADREVLAALARLRPTDREVIRLRLWEEAGYEEIAAVLGCSHHAAEQRYGKALRRLRSVCRRSGHVWMSETEPVSHLQEQHREA